MKKLILLLLLVSCGNTSTNKDEKVYRVAQEFQPYVDKFEMDASKLGKHVKIDYLIIEFKKLDDLGKDKIGACYTKDDGGGTPTVYVDPEYWENGVMNSTSTIIKNNPDLLEAAREYIIFHELGHCILKHAHRDGAKGADPLYPTSIMNTYALSPSFYLGINTTKTPSPDCQSPAQNTDCLLTELFYPNLYDYAAVMSGASAMISESPIETPADWETVQTLSEEEFSRLHN